MAFLDSNSVVCEHVGTAVGVVVASGILVQAGMLVRIGIRVQ